jgi:uncharacterized repeat protein (TIGR01451 family)
MTRSLSIALLLAISLASPRLLALAGGDVATSLVSSPDVVIDSNNECVDGPGAATIIVSVTNTSGAALSGLSATLEGLDSFSLLDSPARALGELAAGEQRRVAWRVAVNSATCTDGTADAVQVSVDDGTGATASAFTLTLRAAISANAGGSIQSQTMAAGDQAVGGTGSVDVVHSFGGVLAGDAFNLQPAGMASALGACRELVATEILASDLPLDIPVGTQDQLYFVAVATTPGTGHLVTVRHTFRSLCSGSTTVLPFASQQSGGTNFRYSGNYGTCFDPGVCEQTFATAAEAVTGSLSVTPAQTTVGQSVQFTYELTNSSNASAFVDGITLALPAGVTFAGTVTGPACGGTNQISPPLSDVEPVAGATGVVTYLPHISRMGIPQYEVLGMGTLRLCFAAVVNALPATVTAEARIGNTSSGSSGATVTGTAAPGIAKAFSPNPIAVGGVSTLTFTLTNANAGTALTGVAFTDSFPAGLEVAATPAATTTGCGSPTFAPAAGNTSVSFSGGTIAASGTCTVTVNVTATMGGAKVNTTGNVTSTNGGTGNTGTDTLFVIAAPGIAKAFSPDAITVGGTSTLAFTVTNPNAGTALTGVAFTDSFPAGLEVAATPGATTAGCGSPTFAPAAGNTSISFSGGTIAASGTCTVTVNVTATTAGAKVNTTGNVTSTNGGTGNTGTDTLTVVAAAPGIAKAFSPNVIAVGGTSTLAFTVTNPNAGTTLTGVAFTDSFPAGLEVAATPGATITGCGSPTFAPAAGNTSVSFSGGTIAANGTCTVTVNVSPTTGGAKVNTTGNVTSTNGGTGNTGTDTLFVIAAPSIAKAFSPNAIAVGGTSTLAFTVTNPNAGTALTGVAFTDSFPAGLEVAATPGATTTGCGSPTFAPAAGNTSVSFSGGTIAANGTCTVTVNVTATTGGAKVNTTGNVTSTNGGTGNTGTDTLTVTTAPGIAKAFSPNAIAVGGTSTLTFTLTNPNAGTALTGVAFTDSFPAGLEVAATPGATTAGCGSPTFAPAAGNTSVSFSGGTIAASGTCTVTVDVTATTGGAKVNTTGNVTSTNGGTGNTGTDTLTVVTAAPGIAKAFSPNAIAVGGTSTLTFTLTNPNAGTSLTGVAFTDSFPAGLEVAATPGATSAGCGSPTFAPAAGNTSVTFSGGTIAANGTCTVTVDVTPTTDGAMVNTTGNVTSTNGGTGNTGTDTLTVTTAPGIAKAFSPNTIAVGGTSTLTFTLTNPNAGTALTGVAFTDSFPAGLEVAATPGATTAGCGSPTFAPAAGNTSVGFSGGTIAASGTCTVTVDVTATTGGAKVNTTGNVTSTNGGTGNTGTDTLTMLAAPGIAKAFSPNAIAVGGTSTLTFTVTNPNAGSSLTGVAFIDTFPAGLQVAATAAATTTGCGSPTFAPAAGNTSLSFSGGTIVASGTCTVTVDVTATTSGAKVNTTGNVTSTNGGTGNTGTDTLQVGTAPGISKSFAPDPIQVGGTSTLSFTLVNPNPGIALTGVSFTDSFPAGMQVAATPNVTTTGCGSPVFAPAAGNISVAFSGGTVAASGTCTVTVDVTATTAGALVNTSGNVTSSNGGTGNTATDTLTVLAPPAITKVFSPDSIALGGTSTLSFTITNPNTTTALIGVAFSDPFPAGVQVAASPAATVNGCGSPVFAPAAGNTSLSFSGGTVAASGTCTVTVAITATTTGSKVNTTGNVTSTNGGAGNTATDTLLVATPQITVTKSSTFAPANDLDASGGLSPGDTLVYTVLVSNTGGAEALLVTLTDSPDPNTALVAGSVSTTQGTVTTGNASGATTVAVNLGTIPASGQASVTFTVTIDNPLPPGVTSVSNQALVQGSNFPPTVSDDAATGAPGDSTTNAITAIVIAAAPLPIPSGSAWGVMILGLMVAAAAAWRLRI